MRILADTNILARLAQPAHAHHLIALGAMAALDAAGHELIIVPQVLYEFWVVCTRPLSDNGLEMTPSGALSELLQAQRFFTLLLDERGIYARWQELVASTQTRGKSAHDARLAAAMDRHGLTHILTFNGQNFNRFAAVTVLEPAQTAVSPP
jgi:predicted nucleic acid-binding protein